jgi:hypothetical protein
MFVAEMLKDKIDNDNYAELCEKAYKFITNGIALPPQEKDQFAEVMKNLTSGLTQAMQNGGNIADSLPKPQMNDKKRELENLYLKHAEKRILWNAEPCFICGYSTEFDCLIAGCQIRGLGNSISKDDMLFDNGTYNSYFYVPKYIVKE